MAKRRAIPKAVKDRVLVEAMHRCCLCPEHPDVTDVHHILPISEDGPNTEENLIVVCPTCHAKIHRFPNSYNPTQLRMYKQRWVEQCANTPRMEGPSAELGPPVNPRGYEASSLLNPFCDRGRINDPDRCFDRKRILRELRQMLAAGNSVSLVGEQEIGKSSVLYCLYQNRAEWLPHAKVVFLDLQGVVDEDDFCAELLEEIGQEAGDLRTLKRTLRKERVVLLLDEAEKLADPTFSPRLHSLLRALAQEPTLTLAVTSHQPLANVFPPSSPTSPFHNIFTEKCLGPFTAKDARAFLTHRLKGTGMAFTPEEIERLMQESGGHPARLQRLAYDLFEQRRR